MEGACVTNNQENPRMLVKGEPQEIIKPEGERMSTIYRELLEDMGEKDVFIKSANALDPWGNVGVLAASPGGGNHRPYPSSDSQAQGESYCSSWDRKTYSDPY